ncbi:hypothetical protein EVAR_40234_1 [Eumeta japonica]|uniref:Uncharacterized protein n=1 Tax=Eumeta variegata TaxID=151549 RepID=A0A4C1X9X7_EUMVA|nr:hypothetical protein EVAR_40234_1 [Eumeta japonica]
MCMMKRLERGALEKIMHTKVMVACLGVMFARLNSLIGTNLVGAFIKDHCTATFYSWSAFVFLRAAYLVRSSARSSHSIVVRPKRSTWPSSRSDIENVTHNFMRDGPRAGQQLQRRPSVVKSSADSFPFKNASNGVLLRSTRLQLENGPPWPERYHTLTENGQVMQASEACAVALHLFTESSSGPLPLPSPHFIRHQPIPLSIVLFLSITYLIFFREAETYW